LNSCGNSSRLDRRRKRPTGVTRELLVARPLGPRGGVVAQQALERRRRVQHHGAELEATEQPSFAAHAPAAVQQRGAIDTPDAPGHPQHQRAEQDQQQGRGSALHRGTEQARNKSPAAFSQMQLHRAPVEHVGPCVH
jgi:hypothetical protein